jgi:hypothetical protein
MYKQNCIQNYFYQ